MSSNRLHGEKDITLKSAIRRILWAQGFSTRVDVLLAYELDGREKRGRSGLTDLDVLGVRLDPGFHVERTIADCKTSASRVPERVFWLRGVREFFGADTSLLVRSQPFPRHVPRLARSLGVSLVGPDDLTIMANTYPLVAVDGCTNSRDAFFSPELVSEGLARLSRLPEDLKRVQVYRESAFWMERANTRVQHLVGMLQLMARDGSRGPTYLLVFSDYVWLCTVALWDICSAVALEGPSNLERALGLYLSGYEAGLENLDRMRRAVQQLAQRAGLDNVALPTLPPYFPELAELVARCVRRPAGTARMARYAEWVVLGRMVGGFGEAPWNLADEDLMGKKLLGDVARFLVKASGLSGHFLNAYLEHLGELAPSPESSYQVGVEAAQSSAEVAEQSLLDLAPPGDARQPINEPGTNDRSSS